MFSCADKDLKAVKPKTASFVFRGCFLWLLEL